MKRRSFQSRHYWGGLRNLAVFWLMLVLPLAGHGQSDAIGVTGAGDEREMHSSGLGGQYVGDAELQRAPLAYALSNTAPEGYVLGPAVSLPWQADESQNLWLASYNFHSPLGPDTYIDPESHYCEPAVLRIWEPRTSRKEMRLRQEFKYEGAFVREMGWVEVENKPILYVLTFTFGCMDANVGTLSCFRVEDDGTVGIVSEEMFEHLWRVDNLDPWGTVFVDWFRTTPFFEVNYFTLRLITYVHGGYYCTSRLPLSALMGASELDVVSTADDLEAIIRYRLKWTDGWRDEIEVADRETEFEEHMRWNLNGEPYFSFAYRTGWIESDSAAAGHE